MSLTPSCSLGNWIKTHLVASPSKAMFLITAMVGLAAIAVFIATLPDGVLKDPDAILKKPDHLSPFFRLRSYVSGIAALTFCVGMPIAIPISAYFWMKEYKRLRKSQQKDPSSSLESIQRSLVSIGLCVAVFGATFALIASYMHHHSAFSDPNNNSFYVSGLTEVGSRLDCYTAVGWIIAAAGGGIVGLRAFSSFPVWLHKKWGDYTKSKAVLQATQATHDEYAKT